jgi:autotransporter-associated beta strand protein
LTRLIELSSAFLGSGEYVIGTVTKSGSGLLTLTGANTYTGGTTISAGTLQIGSGGTSGSIIGNVTNNGTFVFNRSDSVTFAGIVSGTGSLTQSGTGTLTLTGANTYTGGTTISSAATLALSGAGTIAASSLIINDGIFDISATTSGASIAELSGNGSIVLGAKNLNMVNPVSYFTGVISGTGSITLTKTATDSFSYVARLAGANTYTGGTTINNETELTIGSDGGAGHPDGLTTGSIIGNVVTNGTGVLRFGRSNAYTFSGVISGSGQVRQDGVGTITLTGANTYTGGTTVSAGTLALSGTGSIANSSSLMVNGNLDVSAITSSYSNVASLSGAGTVALGSKTLVLSAAAGTFSGVISGSADPGTGGVSIEAGTETWPAGYFVPA